VKHQEKRSWIINACISGGRKRVEGEKGLQLQLLVVDCSVEGGKSSLLTLGGSFDARNQREMCCCRLI
jgi:hypothetical protein